MRRSSLFLSEEVASIRSQWHVRFVQIERCQMRCWDTGKENCWETDVFLSKDNEIGVNRSYNKYYAVDRNVKPLIDVNETIY